MTSASTGSHGNKPAFLAFASDAKDMDAIRQFVAAHQWPESSVQQGDIRTAATFLKSNPSPKLLLVEVPSAAEAPALLDGLAEVCDPETKVIIIGNINEYSFYVWLTEIGIFSYLLRPMTLQALEGAYAKSQDTAKPEGKQEKQQGKLIVVTGTRGGVGATNIAINLAGIIAELSQKHVALLDMDPHGGSIALALDLEPSRGLREALEKPDRIDSLFIERVMNKPNKNLSVLSAEESIQNRVEVHADAADTLLKEMRSKFEVVVIDIPRQLSDFTQRCLAMADEVVLVTELSLLSLRDALRHGDLLRETLKIKPAIVVANRVGAVVKYEMKTADFDKGINAKVAYSVPFAPDVFMQIGTDIPALKSKTHAAVKPLYQLAEQLFPEAKSDETATKAKGGFFGGGKKKEKKKDEED